MDKVDILTCVSDPLLIEEDVLKLWLSGYPGIMLRAHHPKHGIWLDWATRNHYILECHMCIHMGGAPPYISRSSCSVGKAVDWRCKHDSSCSSFDRIIVRLDTEDQYQVSTNTHYLIPLYPKILQTFRNPPALVSPLYVIWDPLFRNPPNYLESPL